MHHSIVHRIHLSSSFGQSCATQDMRYMVFCNAYLARERQKWPYPRSMFH